MSPSTTGTPFISGTFQRHGGSTQGHFLNCPTRPTPLHIPTHTYPHTLKTLFHTKLPPPCSSFFSLSLSCFTTQHNSSELIRVVPCFSFHFHFFALSASTQRGGQQNRAAAAESSERQRCPRGVGGGPPRTKTQCSTTPPTPHLPHSTPSLFFFHDLSESPALFHSANKWTSLHYQSLEACSEKKGFQSFET